MCRSGLSKFGCWAAFGEYNCAPFLALVASVQRLVAANWKMHGLTADAVARACAIAAWWAAERPKVDVVLFPPALHVQQVRALVPTQIGVGLQDAHQAVSGAFTGCVSAEMAVDAGAEWLIVGHSERRRIFGESDALVSDKLAAALRAGLRPVLCVGEDSDERDQGTAASVVERQLEAAYLAVGASGFARLVIAYEPIWAIGTGRNASPAQVDEMHKAVRGFLLAAGLSDVRVLYGGSVNSSNAAALFALESVDGALVGGASLIADQFIAICQAAARGVV